MAAAAAATAAATATATAAVYSASAFRLCRTHTANGKTAVYELFIHKRGRYTKRNMDMGGKKAA